MARALSSIQFHPRLVPRLTDLRRISNLKHPSSINSNPLHAPKPNLTMAFSPYPFPFSTKCNSFTRLRPPFPIPHGNAPFNATVAARDNAKAIDTVVELYNAMRNRNPQVFPDLIADDCKCTCYFTPLFHSLEGKERVVGFLTALLGSMGEHLVFEIETSCHGEGDHVGILWQMEWKGNLVPFGKGCTIYSCEKKEGKLLIRNMQIFMESFFKLGLLQLKNEREKSLWSVDIGEADGNAHVALQQVYKFCPQMDWNGNKHIIGWGYSAASLIPLYKLNQSQTIHRWVLSKVFG